MKALLNLRNVNLVTSKTMTELQDASDRLDVAINRLDTRITEVEVTLTNLANGPA